MAYPLVSALVVLPTEIETVGAGANFFRCAGHFDDAAGVVSDWTGRYTIDQAALWLGDGAGGLVVIGREPRPQCGIETEPPVRAWPQGWPCAASFVLLGGTELAFRSNASAGSRIENSEEITSFTRDITLLRNGSGGPGEKAQRIAINGGAPVCKRDKTAEAFKAA